MTASTTGRTKRSTTALSMFTTTISTTAAGRPKALVVATANTGEPCPCVRCDRAFYETPNGGAVFSTSSIAWAGALAHNGYQNNVSRITANIVRCCLNLAPFCALGLAEARAVLPCTRTPSPSQTGAAKRCTASDPSGPLAQSAGCQ